MSPIAQLPTYQVGSVGGPVVVYFHGTPGDCSEIEWLKADAEQSNLDVLCLERGALDISLRGHDYFHRLAAEIRKHTDDEPIDVIGFSIGAFVAIQVARLLGRQVRSLHLISAASPLEAGNFLANMAGRDVFKLAQSAPLAFRLAARVQGVFASIAPSVLCRILFGSARGGDIELIGTHAFRKSMQSMLKSCLTRHRQGYIRDVLEYVQPWSATLLPMTVPIKIWHGSHDNWTPLPMANYLKTALEAEAMHVLNGCSHYSCLLAAWPLICREIDPTEPGDVNARLLIPNLMASSTECSQIWMSRAFHCGRRGLPPSSSPQQEARRR